MIAWKLLAACWLGSLLWLAVKLLRRFGWRVASKEDSRH
jgi:hypothetical protein